MQSNEVMIIILVIYAIIATMCLAGLAVNMILFTNKIFKNHTQTMSEKIKLADELISNHIDNIGECNQKFANDLRKVNQLLYKMLLNSARLLDNAEITEEKLRNKYPENNIYDETSKNDINFVRPKINMNIGGQEND